MFKDYLVNQMRQMDNREFNVFIKYVLNYHKEILKREDVRPNEIEKAIDKLINGETRSIYFDYLDSYTYALQKINERNKVSVNGLSDWQPKTWKNLINNITTEIKLPIDVDLEMNNMDGEDARAIQNTLISLILICSNKDKRELKENLKIVEEFFRLHYKNTSEVSLKE